MLVANLIAGPRKVERLVELRRKADPIIASIIWTGQPISRAMQASGQRVRAILEVDIGLARAGVLPGKPAVELAQRGGVPGIEFVGIMGYEGHLLLIEDQGEKAGRIARPGATRRDGGAHGGGGHRLFDRLLRRDGFARLRRQPARNHGAAGRGRDLHGRVLSLQVPARRLSVRADDLDDRRQPAAADRAIIDAGRKTMNIELTLPLVMGRDGVDRLRPSTAASNLVRPRRT